MSRPGTEAPWCASRTASADSSPARASSPAFASVRACVRNVLAVTISAPEATSSPWIVQTSSGSWISACALHSGSVVFASRRWSSVPMAASSTSGGPDRSRSRNRLERTPIQHEV